MNRIESRYIDLGNISKYGVVIAYASDLSEGKVNMTHGLCLKFCSIIKDLYACGRSTVYRFIKCLSTPCQIALTISSLPVSFVFSEA
jgi:hypothetical protein